MMLNWEELDMGDKVEILRGTHKGKVFTVHQSANDWATIDELVNDHKRYVQPKRNLKLIQKFIE